MRAWCGRAGRRLLQGPAARRAASDLERGVKLHRAIDAYTDNHPPWQTAPRLSAEPAALCGHSHRPELRSLPEPALVTFQTCRCRTSTPGLPHPDRPASTSVPAPATCWRAAGDTTFSACTTNGKPYRPAPSASASASDAATPFAISTGSCPLRGSTGTGLPGLLPAAAGFQCEAERRLNQSRHAIEYCTRRRKPLT